MHLPWFRTPERAKETLAMIEENPNLVISYGGVRDIAEWPAEREILIAELKAQAGIK